jgi:hypothetical protein
MVKPKARPTPRNDSNKRLMPKPNAPEASQPRNPRTKHDKILKLLRAKEGASIAAITKATGWQPHSVRGFLAGVVKKRLRLNLTSEKAGTSRIYRIVTARSPSQRRSPPAEGQPNA